MPKLLQKNGFSFYFWSEEGNEPPHVHVSKGEGLAKWWLTPKLRAEYSNGFKKPEQRQIKELIEEHHEAFIKAWEKYFNAHG